MTERASLAVQNLPMIDIEERGGGAVKHRQTDRIRRTQVLCLWPKDDFDGSFLKGDECIQISSWCGMWRHKSTSTIKSNLYPWCAGNSNFFSIFDRKSSLCQNVVKTDDQSVTAPQTFHLPSLLADLDGSDRTANQWAKEFLKTSSSDHLRSKSITNMDFTEISWTGYS